MSKTDKTRPFKAQVPDSPREVHDHSKGECDLPTLEEWRKMSRKGIWRTNCTWQPSNWRTYKGFKRSAGEKFWRSEDRKRRDKAMRERDNDD